MKLLRRRPNNPTGGYSVFFHIILTAVLPILIYVLVELGFEYVALATILLSKWRMFAVKLRHWPANIRANAVDIFVGFSVIRFMWWIDVQALDHGQSIKLVWAGLYTTWLLFIKPRSAPLWVGIQALIAQTLALVATYLALSNSSETAITLSVWIITYFSARHFLSAFDEAMAKASAYTWAFFSASLAWLTSHWLILFYSVSQPALIITVIAYGMAALYYLDHTDRMRKELRVQFISIMVFMVLFILVFSNWSGTIV